MHTIVYSHKLQRIAAEGIARLACYDYVNLKKAKIPDELLAKITTLQGF
jgi:acyl-CoA thioester hydrolase